MKRIALCLIAVLCLASAAEAGPIRNLLGKGKAAGKAVLRKASHPFGGCAIGRCN